MTIYTLNDSSRFVSTDNNNSGGGYSGIPCYNYVTLKDFTHLSVLPALFIVLFLSIFEKRKNPRRWKCLNGRPGLLTPVNLLDGDEDRLAYAAAFGSTATNCLTLIQGHFIPPEVPMWFKIFYAMLAVVEMGIDYYPLFACLSKKNSLIDSMLGLVYSLMWFLVNFGHVFDCSNDAEWLFKGQSVVIQLPVLLCLLYLVCVFVARFLHVVLQLIIKLFSGMLFNASEAQTNEQMIKTIDSQNAPGLAKYQIRHVKELLKGHLSSLPSLDKLKRMDRNIWSVIKYRHDPTYRFSLRITSTLTVATMCLYEFALISFLGVTKTLNLIEREFKKIDESDIVKVFGAAILNQLDLLITTVRACWCVSYIISTVVLVNFIVKIFLTYRIHSCRLMRGDNSFIPKKIRSAPNSMIMNRSLMYSGSQVAYMLWGYYFMNLMLFLLLMLISYFIVLPFTGKVSYDLLFIFWAIVPTIIVSYMLLIGQQICCSRLFLQKKIFPDAQGKLRRSLALDNRRIYHIVSYFLFFFYTFVSLSRAVIRTFKSIILAVIYLSRIDRTNLTPGYQQWDPGYISYLCVLQVELTHCHPVLVTFCHILIDEQSNLSSISYFNIQSNNTVSTSTFQRLKHRRIVNKWLKLYTLIQNPDLIKNPDKKALIKEK